MTPNATYDSTRTYVVTSLGDNVLARGNEPLNTDGTFSYDALNSTLKKLLKKSVKGFDLNDYKLIDLSIIDNNPDSEGGDLQLEFAAYGMSEADFNTNFPYPDSWPPVYKKLDVKKQWQTTVCGHPGTIVWYPVQGCSDLDNCKLVEPPQFDFVGMVDFLHNLLTTEEKTVIYFHCEHGHDRTSALAAGYMMKYMKRTLTQVLTQPPPVGAKAFSHDWETNYEQLVGYYATIASAEEEGRDEQDHD